MIHILLLIIIVIYNSNKKNSSSPKSSSTASIDAILLPDLFAGPAPLLSLADYECSVQTATNPSDCTAIPVTLLHSRAIRRDHSNPLLDGDFNPLYLPFLQHDWVVAWAELGRQMQKRNTFDD